jgi:hypothetical protein
MESLPESSKPFDDISDHGISDHIGDDIIGDLVKVDRGMSNNQEIDVRDRLTFSNLGIVLSIPLLGSLIVVVIIYLANPLAISWLASSDAPVFYSNSLWNIPKSIKQIQSELAQNQLKLGESYNLKTGEIIYTVIEIETQNIREIRFYQAIWDRGVEKFLLVSTTTIAGIDEYFVRSPLLKYITYPIPEGLKPNRRRLPLKKLSLLANPPSQLSGIWFSTSGYIDGIAYGQIYCFLDDKRSQLIELEPWTSPANELPVWRNVLGRNILNSNSSSMQLVVNQTQEFEPTFVVFQPEEIITNSIRNIQLRQVNLNEAKNQPKIYQDALVLASVGLWSTALEKFNVMVEQLKAQGKSLSPFLQEQYDFIDFHSKITHNQAENSNFNLGEKALAKIVDGRWSDALAIANDPAYKGDRIVEMLAKYHPRIWQRAMTALTFTSATEIKLWAGLVVLHRDGLRRAEHWLREQKVDVKDSNQLLQRLDLAPISIKPQQMLGTVAYIGKGNAGAEWFLPPPKLDAGQAWYEVSITMIKDGDKWRSGPFSELSDRSSILLWKILGLSLNNNLGLLLYDADGKTQSAVMTAQSLWVGGDGRLKILASGDASLLPLLNKSIIPPLVTSGSSFDPPKGKPIDWQMLSPRVIERIIRAMYGELQRRGQVSMSIEDFSVLLQQQWKLSEVNLDGYGKPEYLLLLDRSEIDLGDRHYPLAIAFSNDGALLFSDMNDGRIWIDVLPSSIEGQILTLRNGNYEIWDFR